jgi:transcriptional regulator with XRE-family HTH domain
MEAIDETLGRRVRRLRIERGWSLRDLAERTGLSYAHLAKMERDEVPFPGYRTVEALAESLGISKERMMGEPDATA